MPNLPDAIRHQVKEIRRALVTPDATTAILLVDGACCKLLTIAAELEQRERTAALALATIGGNETGTEPDTDDFTEVLMYGGEG